VQCVRLGVTYLAQHSVHVDAYEHHLAKGCVHARAVWLQCLPSLLSENRLLDGLGDVRIHVLDVPSGVDATDEPRRPVRLDHWS
jgi:hypothetical protein